MSDLHRIAAFLAFGVAAAVVVAASTHATSTQKAAKTVVIAELFTSEGCSSCPPADDLLRRLIATQPVDGVEIVALGNHVDYWDRLGWRDPLSSPLFSARQSAYDAAVFRSDRIYTPQLVVDGPAEVIGSDAAAVRRTIVKAAARPKATVTFVALQEGDGRAQIDVRVEVPSSLQRHPNAEILVAVTEDGLSTRVGRGENGGRTVAHGAVVRSLTTAGHLKADETAAATTVAVTLAPEWNPAHLRIVGFVQEQTSRRILGGGSTALRSDR